VYVAEAVALGWYPDANAFAFTVLVIDTTKGPL